MIPGETEGGSGSGCGLCPHGAQAPLPETHRQQQSFMPGPGVTHFQAEPPMSPTAEDPNSPSANKTHPVERLACSEDTLEQDKNCFGFVFFFLIPRLLGKQESIHSLPTLAGRAELPVAFLRKLDLASQSAAAPYLLPRPGPSSQAWLYLSGGLKGREVAPASPPSPLACCPSDTKPDAVHL